MKNILIDAVYTDNNDVSLWQSQYFRLIIVFFVNFHELQQLNIIKNLFSMIILI